MTILRYNIIESLQTLASKEAQLEYQREVPIADVAAELVCWWFDDSYHPTDAIFRKSFTEAELGRLAEFNTFYDARVELLPETLEEYMVSPTWDEVVQEAQQTLRDLGWDRLKLQWRPDLPLEE